MKKIDVIRIKEFREQKGWTRRELALKAGVSASYISRLEDGTRPNISALLLDKITAALQISYSEIIAESGGQELSGVQKALISLVSKHEIESWNIEENTVTFKLPKRMITNQLHKVNQ